MQMLVFRKINRSALLLSNLIVIKNVCSCQFISHTDNEQTANMKTVRRPIRLHFGSSLTLLSGQSTPSQSPPIGGDWNNIADSVEAVFSRLVKPTSRELYALQEKVRRLVYENAYFHVYEQFCSLLIPKGMNILLKEINDAIIRSQLQDDEDLFHVTLDVLVHIWQDFFSEILPTLQAAFIGVKPGIRNTALTAFRDNVVLKPPVRSVIENCRRSAKIFQIYRPFLTQMLLVLHTAGSTEQTSYGANMNNFQLLEQIASIVVTPFLPLSDVDDANDDVFVPSQSKEDHSNSSISTVVLRQSLRPVQGHVKTLPELLARSVRLATQRRYGSRSSLLRTRSNSSGDTADTLL